MNAHEISLAFNQTCPKKTWTARAYATGDVEQVLFSGSTNTVQLTYNVKDRRFAIAFLKVQAAWGDYVKAAARALYTVLTTLKAAGLPFEAPASPAGIEIIATASDDNTVYVRWPGAVVDNTMTANDSWTSTGFLATPLNSL